MNDTTLNPKDVHPGFLGAYLKAYLVREEGASQEAFAKRHGITRSMVSLWVNEQQAPSRKYLAFLLDLGVCTVEQIRKREETPGIFRRKHHFHTQALERIHV